MRKEMILEVGHTYRGSAYINQFGEITFTAYQPSEENQNRLRKICTGHSDVNDTSFALYHTDGLVQVRLNVRKSDYLDMLQCLQEVFEGACETLESYRL